MLFAFDTPDAAKEWMAVNDGVMGGVSDGRFKVTDAKTMEFFGTLSLENNGGFASVRSKPKALGLTNDDSIVVRVRGDGREYTLNLYVPTQRIAFSYRATIKTKAGEWIEVSVPIRDFDATSFGDKVPDAGPVDAGKVNALGFLRSDKKAGPFKLERQAPRQRSTLERGRALRPETAVMPEPRKLTVVEVLPALQSGGVERGTLEVGQSLAAHGHRSIVISAGGRMVEQLEREGSKHVAWDIGKKSLGSLRLIPKLRRFRVENRVDILHVRSRVPAWIAYLAWKGMDPKSRPRFVTTVHGLYSVNAYSAIMTRGERVIAVSETTRDYILRNYPNTPPERIVVIPRGVDRAEYPHGYRPAPQWTERFFRDFPRARDKLLLTLPGRITWVKGHEDFIEIVRRLKQDGLPVHGLIVGGADNRKQAYLEKLRGIIEAAGLASDISFTGQRSDMKEIASSGSASCVPSLAPLV